MKTKYDDIKAGEDEAEPSVHCGGRCASYDKCMAMKTDIAKWEAGFEGKTTYTFSCPLVKRTKKQYGKVLPYFDGVLPLPRSDNPAMNASPVTGRGITKDTKEE